MKKIVAILLTLFLVACLPVRPGSFNSTDEDAGDEDVVVIEAENKTEMTEPELKAPETPVIEGDYPEKIVTEGDLVNFPNLKATDPDGDPIKYAFSKPLDLLGKWQTKVGDAGEYLVTITASDGENTVDQQIKIVVKPKNAPPVIQIEDSIEVKEGEKVVLSPVIEDPDGDKVTVTYSGFMTQKEYVTDFTEAGSHKVKITATDGQNIEEKEIFVIVRNVNRAPVIDAIEDITITEGDKVIVTPTGMDPDGDKIRYSFSEPLDAAGKWKTKIGDAGRHEITVTASDDEDESKIVFEIIVESLNKAPVIEIADITVDEGETVKLNPVITDPEGDEFSVTYSGWMTSNSKTTNYDDQGIHTVTIAAKDTAGNEAKENVKVTVNDINRPPVFDPNSFI